MRDGAIVAAGAPARSSTPSWSSEVFGLRCRVVEDPETGTPLIVAAARERRQSALGEAASATLPASSSIA